MHINIITQGARGTATVSAWPAEGQHVCQLSEGRQLNEEVARAARQESGDAWTAA